jgi:hypothetical protein
MTERKTPPSERSEDEQATSTGNPLPLLIALALLLGLVIVYGMTIG